MPIKIPNGLPAAQTLAEENIFVMAENRAATQDIRPLQILVLNLMPTKIATETQLARLLGNTPLQVELELIHTSTHESKNTAREHLLKFYKTFDQIKDRYFDGMKNTANVVESYGFGFVGAYRTRQERETGACIQEVNGIKLGFVAYTHSTNTMETACSPDVKEYGVPYIQKADFKGDIQRLKDAGADVIIALPHWGDEYIQQPDGNQIYYAGKLASAGADIILGSHSHMVQPMEYKVFTDANGVGREVFAIFSMGNFISDMTKKYTDSGIILDFTIQEQADGTFRVENVGYVPLYMWKQDGQYSVVSSAQYLNSRPTGMDDANYNRMVETYSELQQVLGTNWRVLEK